MTTPQYKTNNKNITPTLPPPHIKQIINKKKKKQIMLKKIADREGYHQAQRHFDNPENGMGLLQLKSIGTEKKKKK